jgi:hypothetical protein
VRTGEEDDDVFDEREEAAARERAPSPADAFLSAIVDAAEEKTVAQPRRFDPDAIVRGQSVELSSLLAPESPLAVVDVPTPREDTVRRPITAAPPPVPVLVGRRAPEFLQSALAQSTAISTAADARAEARRRPARLLEKPIVLAAALGVAVIGVATLVSFGIESQGEVQAAAPVHEAAKPEPQTKRRTIAPVTITLEEEEEKAAAEPDPPPPPPPREETPVRTREQRPRLAPVSHKAPPPRVEKKKEFGYLNVGAKPWAEISINGKPWPYQTPQAGIELPVGRHTVTLFNRETGVTRTKVVQIKQGTYQTISVDMTKK